MSPRALASFQFLLAALVGLATLSALVMGFAGIGFSFGLLLLGAIGMSCVACLLVVCDSLQRFQNYKFCIAIAACECILFPFGTILGLFTIQTLMSPKIKEKFRSSVPMSDQDSG